MLGLMLAIKWRNIAHHQSKFTETDDWRSCVADFPARGSLHMSCRVTIWIWGLNQLCQSSYVTPWRCPAPDDIWGSKQFLVDICLDLNACLLSYFWLERYYDGLLLQPALLTRDHRCPRLRVMLAVCSKVTVEADFCWSIWWKSRRKIHPRILFQISSICDVLCISRCYLLS